MPGLADPQRLSDLLGQTAKLTFRMVDPSMSRRAGAAGTLPPESELLYGAEKDRRLRYVDRKARHGRRRRPHRRAARLRPAHQRADRHLPFNTNGARRFAQATQENVGRPFAIVLDNKVISAPVIREPILGGSGQISGNFTVEPANDLAVLLRAGALPAPLTIDRGAHGRPGLGQDSIDNGHARVLCRRRRWSSSSCSLTYGMFGADRQHRGADQRRDDLRHPVAAQRDADLPGIAGIVLTIGMAVDSNVLIYERIREEVRAGRTAIAAIDAGFTRALATILDSNITTFIAAAVLFFIGTGPGARLRGDARHRHHHDRVHRLHADAADRRLIWLRWTPAAGRADFVDGDVRTVRFHLKHCRCCASSRTTPSSTSCSSAGSAFRSRRCCRSLAIVLFFHPGLNFGIDFKGGTLIEVQAKPAPADLGKMRATLSGLGLGEVQLQQFGGPADVLIRVAQQPGGEAAQQAAVAEGPRRARRRRSNTAASRWSARASRASCLSRACSASSRRSSAS